jgi:hypothetical protein
MQNVGGREGVYIRFRWGKLRERDHLEEQDVDERIILRWIFRKWDGGMDLIDKATKRDRCRALVNVVMNFRFP